MIRIACLSALLGIAGCVTVPPDKNSLPQQDAAQAGLAADIHLARDGWPQAQWWTQYGDPQLNQLIAQALASSPTLALAAARIGSAQSTLALSEAAEGIDVGANAAVNRQRYSGNGLFPAPIGGNYFTDENIQLQARYDFDWWGRHRAQIASALGEANARRADYAQAEQTLAAVIAQHYFTLQGDWALLDAARNMTKIRQALVDDSSRRVAHGIGGIDEQHAAEIQLVELNRQAVQLGTQIVREREALRALLGAGNTALTDLKPQPLPPANPGLPSRLGVELLARRPDLQAARWRVEAALGRVDAAQAAFYPDINLAGAIGLDAISLSHLLESASRTLFAGPTLSLPLFNSRSLQGQLGVARSERNALIADYNQSVFDAVREVAQAGAALQGTGRELQQQNTASESAHALLHSAQAKYTRGLSDRAHLLLAQLAVQQQDAALLQLQNRQLLADVALVKALGGGYRADSPGTHTASTASTK